MLTLVAGPAESLWDEALPVEMRELPEDLAALDLLLSDAELLAPIVERFRREVEEERRAVLTDGRPTNAMEAYVRLMVLKQRYRWGYRTLIGEVSDPIHLRRFCRISLIERGARRVDDQKAHAPARRRDGERTHARVDRQDDARAAVSAAAGADRLDRGRGRRQVPDRRWAGVARGAGLGAGGAQAGSDDRRAEGASAGSLAGDGPAAAGDRPHDPPPRRRGQDRGARADCADRRTVAALGHRDAPAGRGRPAQGARSGRTSQLSRGGEARRAGGPLRAGRAADHPARGGRADHRPDRVARGPGCAADPQGQARQAVRVRVCDPASGGDREHQARRASADPAGIDRTGQSVGEHAAARHRRRAHAAGDRPARGGTRRRLQTGPTNQALADLAPDRVFIAGRQEPDSRRTKRRLERYRTGEEGRISHLKRRYSLERGRLKGAEGQQIWTEWAILAYDLDTVAGRAR